MAEEDTFRPRPVVHRHALASAFGRLSSGSALTAQLFFSSRFDPGHPHSSGAPEATVARARSAGSSRICTVSTHVFVVDPALPRSWNGASSRTFLCFFARFRSGAPAAFVRAADSPSAGTPDSDDDRRSLCSMLRSIVPVARPCVSLPLFQQTVEIRSLLVYTLLLLRYSLYSIPSIGYTYGIIAESLLKE